MKRLLLFISVLIGFSAAAQTNVFLDQTFWQNQPGVEQIKAEMAKGNSPSQLNASSFDPVVMAINAGAPNESIKFLLSQPGNDPAKLTHDGRTYIFWAASKGNTEIMEHLLAKGAKVTVEDSHGYTPLNFAAVGGQQNTKVYDLCLQHGASLKKDLSHDGANALLLAIGNDRDFKLTNYFTSKGLSLNDTDADGNTAFNYAAKAGNVEMLKSLLQKGVKFNDNAMIMASQGSRRGAHPLSLFQYLESVKINPAAKGKNGETALHAIVRRPNQEETIRYFLSKAIDVNQADADGNNVLMNAAASNPDTATLALLVSRIKDINKANKQGQTALTMAVRGNSPTAVQYLLKKGARVNITDTKGDNLASYLVQSYTARRAGEFEEKLKLLQESGLNLTAPQANGNTLYHLAVAKGDLELIKRIGALNIDVNSKNKEGYTALHKAAMTSKDDAILKYLLAVGAQKGIETEMNETAFDLASENEYFSQNNISVNFLK